MAGARASIETQIQENGKNTGYFHLVLCYVALNERLQCFCVVFIVVYIIYSV